MIKYVEFEEISMKRNHKHIVKEVEIGSIAEELGIESGDILLSINDNVIEDVFDYHYYVNDEELIVLIRKTDGEEWELEIEKDYEDDLGIEFEQGLMDEYRSCRNKCMFCFIDQMPKGMRETLYFKDDDSRMSFLFGNYITLTGLCERELQRIIDMHISPVNISVHTMSPKLRVQMMKNPRSGEVLSYLRRFADAGIALELTLLTGFVFMTNLL